MLFFQRAKQYALGTVSGLLEHVHDERDFKFGEVFGSSGYVPKNRQKEIKTLSIKNQQFFNNCTWNAATVAKEVQEGKALSVKFLTAVGKKKDRLWGNGFAYLRDAQQTIVDTGICEESLCPDIKTDWNIYSSDACLTYNNTMNAVDHKSSKYFWIQSLNDYLMALDGNNAVQTGFMWYTDYNQFNVKDKLILNLEKGIKIGGHSFVCVGYDLDKQLLKFQNSFGSIYGNNGCFYVRFSDWFQPGNIGYVTMDVDNSQIIASYEGKDLKSNASPAIYRIDNGKKRVFLNESIFFKNGGRFGLNKTWQLVSSNILNSIPEGLPME